MKDSFQPILKMLTLMVGLLLSVTLLTAVLIGAIVMVFSGGSLTPLNQINTSEVQNLTVAVSETYRGVVPKEGLWMAPEWSSVDQEPNAEDIKYGKELVANTAAYLGPNGKVKKISNGMNCQNCHLNAGTAPLGNNYSAVASTYPKVRARSGQMEDVEKRINDCFERSLNGKALENNSKEMVAMVAYMKWLGKDVPKGESPKGVGIYEVPFLDRAADPVKGKAVYDRQCQSCHMADGQGMPKPDKSGHIYPPLWGDNSYNDGAGLFRMSRFAGYVKTNMPLGATFERPILTDEEAWDVAAYVNSLPRPKKDIRKDWPDISKKPIDHPFGPFSDDFTEEQHKFGPFKPIKEARASASK
ncbi:c-type cytochrome [Aquiflexum gelatinilyticum]|uniref:C-type cytochrome n=1 Tax=Aquiflexum gelatinilyticum TaxID=2961943 RepID=A0A9X2P5C3_9BACT|nr:c-type cytochrome [Aquiflexum gelatinilyticum]MCR9016406.1 c-type cytochrome [Aquiflexum gelatinilyticum]